MNNKNIIKFVQQRLWSNGHHTKRMPDGMSFDLIVDKNIRVKVISEKEIIQFNPQLMDIIATVSQVKDGSYQVFYGKSLSYHKRFKDAIKTRKDGEKK